MAIALGATGWFMYIDIPQTPKAVVICVIVYNAFFGYRYVGIPHDDMKSLNSASVQLGPDPMVVSSGGIYSIS